MVQPPKQEDGFDVFMTAVTAFPRGPIYIPGVMHKNEIVKQFPLSDDQWRELGLWVQNVNNLVANLKNPVTNRVQQNMMMDVGAPGNQSHRIFSALYMFFGDGMNREDA